MISVYQLKPAFQNLLRPLVGLLARWGVTANQVTVLAGIISILTGIGLTWFLIDPMLYLSVPAVLFVRMALNAMDGMLAREHAMESALGGILNELFDVISDAALYLPFALHPQVSAPWIVVIVILSGLTEFTGVVAVQVGAGRRYDGPMGKSDRAVVFGALALVLALQLPVFPWAGYLLPVITLLLVWTIINRARKALAEV